MGLFSRHSELYDFARGPQHWYYTSDGGDVVYAGVTYAAQPGLKRNAIVLTQELEKAALQITVPWDFPLLAIYRPTPPSQRVTVTVRRLAKGATTAAIAWTGVVTDVSDPDEHSSILDCAGGLSQLTANGLRRKWQGGCPLTVYGSGLGQCNKPMADVRTDGTVTGGTGTTVQAAAFATHPDGWFNGGFISWQVGVATEMRFVVTHVGNTLNLLTPAVLAVGQSVAAYPGCDHTVLGGCTKLNNVPNYGGQLYLPVKNPMGNNPIF